MREKSHKQEKRHKVERTCIGCMKKDSKAAMVRIAVVESNVEADFAASAEGRGAYLHRTNECAVRFVNSKVREFRSLRRKIDRSERLRIVEAIKLTLDRNSKVE